MVDPWVAYKSCIIQDRGASRLRNGWICLHCSSFALHNTSSSRVADSRGTSGLARPLRCCDSVCHSFRYCVSTGNNSLTEDSDGLLHSSIWYAGLIGFYVDADGYWGRVREYTRRWFVWGGSRGGSVVFYVSRRLQNRWISVARGSVGSSSTLETGSENPLMD